MKADGINAGQETAFVEVPCQHCGDKILCWHHARVFTCDRCQQKAAANSADATQQIEAGSLSAFAAGQAREDADV